jgi:hypothetical protein
VTIVEHQSHSVMPDRLYRANPDLLLATHDGLLIGSMPLHFGRGTFDPQIFRRQSIVRTVFERDVKHTRGSIQSDFSRNRHSGHVTPRWREEPGHDRLVEPARTA